MRYLISQIDNEDCRDISRFLFGILFGTANKDFFSMISCSDSPISILEESALGDIQIFDFSYKKVYL